MKDKSKELMIVSIVAIVAIVSLVLISANENNMTGAVPARLVELSPDAEWI